LIEILKKRNKELVKVASSKDNRVSLPTPQTINLSPSETTTVTIVGVGEVLQVQPQQQQRITCDQVQQQATNTIATSSGSTAIARDITSTGGGVMTGYYSF
jgi:hypothetical protein